MAIISTKANGLPFMIMLQIHLFTILRSPHAYVGGLHRKCAFTNLAGGVSFSLYLMPLTHYSARIRRSSVIAFKYNDDKFDINVSKVTMTTLNLPPTQKLAQK